MDKIHDFQKDKTTELARRIATSEKDVYRLVQDEETYHASNGNANGESSTNGNGHIYRNYQSRSQPFSNGDAEEQQRHVTHAQDGGSDDDLDSDDDENDREPGDDTSGRSIETLEEQFRWLEEKVAILVADVHDLALYTKLNLTGFMKILKVRFSVLFSAMWKLTDRRIQETRCKFVDRLMNTTHG